MNAFLHHQPNQRLRAARFERGWTQQTLADQVGTTAVTIKRWERGSQQPSPYFRLKLCALFGKSAEELGLVEAAEKPAAEEARAEEKLVLPPASLETQPETRQRHPPSRTKPHRSLPLLGAGLFSLALIAAVVVYSLHFLLPATHPALSARIHVATFTPTPTPLWHSWPQVLNDALLATSYDPTWEVDSKSAAGPGPIFGICNFSPISHTYQLQTFGANYCPYGSGHEHPWTDLAFSIELSIRQGTWGGLVIRLHQNNFYYFNISTTGTYELLVHQHINGGEDTDVITGTSAAIHQGIDQWNTLLIAARGSSFQLWINGQYVTSATDKTVSAGTIGVAASYGIGHGAPVTVVWFRRAQVWRPTGSS